MKSEFYQGLFEIQKVLKPIGKNADGYNYKYADLPQVWKNVQAVVAKNGFVVYHQVTIEGVKTTALHSSGEALESTVPFSGSIKPQEKGSEITYFKRYNILALFNVIVEGEDDDAKGANDVVKQVSGKWNNKTEDKKLPKKEAEFYNAL